MKRIAALLLSLIMLFAIVGCTAQESNQSEDPVPPAQTPEGAPKAGNPEQGEYTYADTIKWDGEYDVVVVGFGGAGAVAAKTAADAGAGVLIVEKAPEGEEGGNTRYCGQLFAYGNNDYEATLAYYKQLAGGHDVPEEMLEVYADSIARMADVLADEFGANKAEFMDWSSVPLIGTMSPEYPEFEGSEKIGLWTLHQGISDSYLWRLCARTSPTAQRHRRLVRISRHRPDPRPGKRDDPGRDRRARRKDAERPREERRGADHRRF